MIQLNKQQCKCLSALHTPYSKLKTYEPLKYDSDIGYLMQQLWDDTDGVRVEAMKRIYTVSEPFHQLAMQNTGAMRKLLYGLNEHYSSGELYGIYINPKEDLMIVYMFDRILSEDQLAEEREKQRRLHPDAQPYPRFHCKAYLFKSGRLILNGIAKVIDYDIANDNIICNATCNVGFIGKDDAKRLMIGHVLKVLYLELFIRFADTEKVVIENGQHKDHKGNTLPVQNFSGEPVTYYDSRWVREIIRTEGFKVRGHFRLQPCKDDAGEWTKRLIYINEYQKNGYHMRAGKDKNII